MKLILMRKADWDPGDHPRGRDGRFIRAGNRVSLPGGKTGHVLAVTGGGKLAIQRDDGGREIRDASEVAQASVVTAPTPQGKDAVNGHHVPGTPYNWRHGWEPLNPQTARRHGKPWRGDGPKPGKPKPDASPPLKPPRAAVSDWISDEAPFPEKEVGANRDNQLLEIWKRQGFTGKPTVGNAAQLDQAVKDGGVEVWRGLSGDGAHSYVEQLRGDGDPFPGLGMYGNGTYTSTNSSTAQDYARQKGIVQYGSQANDGAMVRMVIPSGAKVIEFSELVKLRGETLTELITAGFAHSSTPEDRARLGKLMDLTQDPGRLASMLGYDAIKHDISDDETYYVVLNRTAVMVAADTINVEAT